MPDAKTTIEAMVNSGRGYRKAVIPVAAPVVAIEANPRRIGVVFYSRAAGSYKWIFGKNDSLAGGQEIGAGFGYPTVLSALEYGSLVAGPITLQATGADVTLEWAEIYLPP